MRHVWTNNMDMKTVLLFACCLGVMACGSEKQPAEKKAVEAVAPTPQKTAPEKMVELDEGKVYPFMELKALYAKNWKGETDGNPVLDGKSVVVSGTVFSSGQILQWSEGGTRVTGARIHFRDGKVGADGLNQDVECIFPKDASKEVVAQKKGMDVKVKGIIEKQKELEEPKEPKHKVLVLTLNECTFAK